MFSLQVTRDEKYFRIRAANFLIVGLNSLLSLACVFDWFQSKQPQQQEIRQSQASQHRNASDNVCGPCALNTGHRALQRESTWTHAIGSELIDTARRKPRAGIRCRHPQLLLAWNVDFEHGNIAGFCFRLACGQMRRGFV